MGKKAFEKGTVVERSKDLYQNSIKFLDAFSLKALLGHISEAKTLQTKILLAFMFAVIVYILLIVAPVYSIVIGAIELPRCLLHREMSIWLIVMGSIFLFYFFVSFVLIGILAIKYEWVIVYQRLLDIPIYLFILAWMILGIVWVSMVSLKDFKNDNDSDSDDTCDMILLVSSICILALYWFVLVAIIAGYIIRLAIMPLILKVIKQ